MIVVIVRRYNIRQASLCFYGRLVSRMVCHKRGRDEHDRGPDGANPAISVATFFRVYVSLADVYCVADGGITRGLALGSS